MINADQMLRMLRIPDKSRMILETADEKNISITETHFVMV